MTSAPRKIIIDTDAASARSLTEQPAADSIYNLVAGDPGNVTRSFFEATNGIDGIFVHDPTAVIVLLEPDAFVMNDWPLRVETESFSRGKTWPDMGNTDEAVPAAWQNRPPVKVCTGVDAERVGAAVEALLTASA